MSNKTQLQSNNTILSTVLDTIHGLPMAEDVKRGVYAWEKSRGINITGTPDTLDDLSSASSWTFTIYKDINVSNGVYVGVGPTTATIDDIGGGTLITTTDHPYYIYNGKAYTNVVTTRGNTLEGNRAEIARGEPIEMLVSDNPNKYPDGGEQGGFWYEKIDTKLGQTLKMIGFIETSIERFTYSTNTALGIANTTYSDPIPHNLGGKPNLVYIGAINPDEVKGSSSKGSLLKSTFSITLSKNVSQINGTNTIIGYDYGDKTYSYWETPCVNDITENSFTLKCGSANFLFFKGGVEYVKVVAR